MRRQNRGLGVFIVTGLLSLTGVLIAATAASAQEEELERGTQLVSGFFGPFLNLTGDSEDADDLGSEGTEFESEWAIGGSYQYFLTPKLSLEASVTFGNGEGEVEGSGNDDPEDGDNEENGEAEDENGDNGGVSGNALYVTGSIIYNFRPEARVKPYVIAGAGLVRIDVDNRNSSRPAGVFGGGVLIGVSKSVLIRVDARDHAYRLDQGGSSSTFNDLSLTGGVCLGAQLR